MREGSWYDDDEDDEGESPFTPTGHMHSMQGMPQDARQMGLDRNVPEGAWLSFAGQLSASKPAHRLVAWLLLLFIVAGFLLTLRNAIF